MVGSLEPDRIILKFSLQTYIYNSQNVFETA